MVILEIPLFSSHQNKLELVGFLRALYCYAQSSKDRDYSFEGLKSASTKETNLWGKRRFREWRKMLTWSTIYSGRSGGEGAGSLHSNSPVPEEKQTQIVHDKGGFRGVRGGPSPEK